jgi:hypothetical protein
MDAPRPHRPVPLTTQVAAAGGLDDVPGRRGELADELADALLRVGAEDPVVALGRADELGLPTMAEVWGDAEVTSRGGLLWTLHLLRAWCAARPGDGARLFRDGRGLAPVGEVVSGLPWAAGETDVAALGERILLTAYAGDLGSAAERAAAFVGVLGAGMYRDDDADRRTRLAQLQRRLELAGRTGRGRGLS